MGKDAKEVAKDYDFLSEENLEEITIKDQSYPTVYAYFELLPQHMRENEVVQNIARALDKYSYNVETVEERIELLNQVCEAVLPFDESKLFPC